MIHREHSSHIVSFWKKLQASSLGRTTYIVLHQIYVARKKTTWLDQQ